MIIFTAGNQNLKIRISRECIKWVLNANMHPGLIMAADSGDMLMMLQQK